MIFDLALTFFTVSAVYLSNSLNPLERKIAPVLGLLAQPIWFYKAYHGWDLGIFLVTIFMSLAWCRGVINQWTKIKL